MSPIDYHYKICAFPKRFDDINKSILFFIVNMNFHDSNSSYREK